jgi:hypothetical protein
MPEPLKFILIMSALIAAVACTGPEIDCKAPQCVVVEGELSEEILVELEDAGSALRAVYVNSRGGKAGIGAQIGKLLLDQNVDLFIFEECSSACAEYLMTAAKRVTAIGEPVVGLHGNSMMREHLGQSQGYFRPEHCKGPSLVVLEEIYAVRGLNSDFFRAQLDRIEPVDLEFFLDVNGCPLFTRYDTHGRMWFPTTEEFQRLLGLKIEGSLCADDPRCKRKLEADL